VGFVKLGREKEREKDVRREITCSTALDGEDI
jgi:hypothetical protein